MPRYFLSVSSPHNDGEIRDFGQGIELARERAHTLDCVVFITIEGARPGCPNRWAVSPRGHLSVEGVELAICQGCGEP